MEPDNVKHFCNHFCFQINTDKISTKLGITVNLMKQLTDIVNNNYDQVPPAPKASGWSPA